MEEINKLVLLIIFITIVILFLNNNGKDAFGRIINTSSIIQVNNYPDNSSDINGIVVFNSSKNVASVPLTNPNRLSAATYLNYNGFDLGEFNDGMYEIGVILPITRHGAINNRYPSPVSSSSNILNWNQNVLKVYGGYWKGSELIGLGIPSSYTLPDINFHDKLFSKADKYIVNSNVVNIEFNQSINTVGRVPYSANNSLRFIRKLPIDSRTQKPLEFGEIFITDPNSAYGWSGKEITFCYGKGQKVKNIDKLMDIATRTGTTTSSCSIM